MNGRRAFVVVFFNFIEHTLDKDSVAFFRIVNENMGYGTYKHIVLNNGASRHSLNNTAGLLKKLRIGDGQDDSFRTRRYILRNLNDFDFIFPYRIVFSLAENVGFSEFDFILAAHLVRRIFA